MSNTNTTTPNTKIPSTKPISLSPISRRMFMGGVAASVAATVAPGCGSGSGTVSCLDGYCDGCGRDYDHCDGAYCNYINYVDGC